MKKICYECGEGWFPLIEEAQAIVDQYNKDHPNLEYPIEFTQIKEKWGYLNLYLNILMVLIANYKTTSMK